ncbi:hypothetical protein [Chromobacterium phragmitis]|uniref:Conjugal transfer protein TrbI n=1 Tax=Chromobacterium phragmitis TaxID=2202141 RepID=A0ABV0J1X3_9NEIS
MIALLFFGGAWGLKRLNAAKDGKKADEISLASTPEKLKESGKADGGALPGMDNHSQPALYPTADALLNGQQEGRQRDAIASGGAYVAEVGALSERPDGGALSQGGGQMPPIPQGQMPPPVDAQAVQRQTDWMRRFQGGGSKEGAPDKKVVNWYGHAPSNAGRQEEAHGLPPGTPADRAQKVASIGERLAAVTVSRTSSYQQGTTVIVRIVEDGVRRDAQLFGSYAEGYDALIVKLSKMRLADGRVVAVDAVLVDKSTNSQAVASAVNGHYLDRFGMLAAGAFLGNYASALTSGGETTISTGGSVTTVPKIDQPGKYALGKTVEAVSQLAAAGAARFNKPEIVLDRNELVGVLFLDDAVIGGK